MSRDNPMFRPYYAEDYYTFFDGTDTPAKTNAVTKLKGCNGYKRLMENSVTLLRLEGAGFDLDKILKPELMGLSPNGWLILSMYTGFYLSLQVKIPVEDFIAGNMARAIELKNMMPSKDSALIYMKEAIGKPRVYLTNDYRDIWSMPESHIYIPSHTLTAFHKTHLEMFWNNSEIALQNNRWGRREERALQRGLVIRNFNYKDIQWKSSKKLSI